MSTTGPVLRAALCVAVAAALAACTGSTPSPDEPSPPVPSVPSRSVPPSVPSSAPSSSAPGPVPVPGVARRLRPAVAVRVAVPGTTLVAGLRLAGSRLAYAACTACARSTSPDALHVLDLRTRRTARVAVTAFAGGVVVPVGLTGDWLVWLDVAPVAPQVGDRTEWALRAYDVARGQVRRLAGTSPSTRSPVPWAVTRDGLVAWQEPDGDALAGPVHVADLAGRRATTTAARLPGLLADVTARGLLYVGASPPGRPDLDVADVRTPSDAYRLPTGGGAAVPLSTSHDVGSVTSDGTTALWSTPRGASDALWAAPVAGGTPAVVYRGRTVERAVGRGFVAVLTGDDPVVRVAPVPAGEVATLPDVPLAAGGLAADGTRLAYVAAPGRDVEPDARHPLEIVVADVR